MPGERKTSFGASEVRILLKIQDPPEAGGIVEHRR
jgi:hypothetical protein